VSGQGSQTIKITRRGTQSSQQGPAENFTGSVRVTPLFAANDPSRASGGSVSFEPGARSAWHTHPQGQVLIVTAGVGRVQQWGGPVEEIRVGDVVWTPPGVKHWHGASPNTAMTHIAIQEHLDGKAVDWLEKVSDQQYGGLPAISREEGASTMANEPQARPNPYADIAPALGEITNKVLFGEVWERPGLSPRDRSLITVATLVATYRTNELPFHLERALENGVTRDEISELITHLAFYAGWPAANTAVLIARDVFKKREK
jgi:4-carboxymuconolactone decarboxylase